MLNKKIPVIYTFLFMILGGVIAYFLINNHNNKVNQITLQKNKYLDSIASGSNYNVFRLSGGFHYIRPILYVEQRTEAAKYASLKSEINKIIDKYKIDGTLITASIYMRKFKNGEFMEINPQDSFQPGSLLKIPIMITYLKMEENTPGTLNSFIICDKLYDAGLKQNIKSQTIKAGQRYTVKELLHYMIVNSDNNATFLLEEYMDINIYNKVYTDLGINIDKMDNRDLFKLSARQYSVFFKVLFNATYLTNDNSEYAAELLCQSDYKDGLIKELPVTVKVAHKFGEAGNNDMHDLSESGVVYLKDNTYLITVMTRGQDLNKLSTVIGDISKLVYNTLSAEQ